MLFYAEVFLQRCLQAMYFLLMQTPINTPAKLPIKLRIYAVMEPRPAPRYHPIQLQREMQSMRLRVFMGYKRLEEQRRKVKGKPGPGAALYSRLLLDLGGEVLQDYMKILLAPHKAVRDLRRQAGLMGFNGWCLVMQQAKVPRCSWGSAWP